MNTLSLPSSFNLSEHQRNSTKMFSPSYANTTQTLSSSFPKTAPQSVPHNLPQSQTKHKNQTQNHHNTTQKATMTLKSENNHFISIDNIIWNDKEGVFTQEMELKIQYTVRKQLEENIAWKVVYLGSAYSQSYDQTLCEFQTQENDPSSSYPQKRQFKLTVQPPKWNLISLPQLFSTFLFDLDISAIVISISYKKQQFLKVGYYVHYQLPSTAKNEASLLFKLQKYDNSPEKQDKTKKSLKTKKISKKTQKMASSKDAHAFDAIEEEILENILRRTVRTILADKLRVTKFQIDWEKQNIAQKFIKMQSQSQPSINLDSQHLITEYTKILSESNL